MWTFRDTNSINNAQHSILKTRERTLVPSADSKLFCYPIFNNGYKTPQNTRTKRQPPGESPVDPSEPDTLYHESAFEQDSEGRSPHCSVHALLDIWSCVGRGGTYDHEDARSSTHHLQGRPSSDTGIEVTEWTRIFRSQDGKSTQHQFCPTLC